MILIKDGQTISLDNENHAEAFLLSGWAEVKTPAASESPKVEESKPEEIKEEVKAEEVKTKSLRGRKKKED